MSRYGDTPEGMVEAALEFVRIFHRYQFHNLVLSMKSSNVRVMVQAYRLLVDRMEAEGFDYPLHLGVTEAGFGIEGRIRSAAGIGLLLDEGIGDTIRVSLTEDPVAEIPVARTLLERYLKLRIHKIGDQIKAPYNPFDYARRQSRTVAGMGGTRPIVVVGDQSTTESLPPDYLWVSNSEGLFLKMNAGNAPLIPLIDDDDLSHLHDGPEPVLISLPDQPDEVLAMQLETLTNPLVVIQIPLLSHPAMFRAWVALLNRHCPGVPIIAQILMPDGLSMDEMAINAAVTASGVFTDGLADGLWIEALPQTPVISLSFSILQATRARFTSTEYISCPSCGRTRFNIQEAVIKIKERTSHLPGLKIGVMGCIVNGPGEMADADYGYVGAGNHTITLYKGKEVVRRGVHEDEAIDALIELIKAHGDWSESENLRLE
jgi:(E)-4-hydroxy-3-methylbut-2-enyl-diphosphate synthase